MKKMWWMIILLLLAAGAFAVFFAARNTHDSAATGGGKRDNTDPDAPKVIHSTEIISFDCAFSTSRRLEAGALNRGYYSLTAAAEDGSVSGSYHCTANAQGNPESASFEADASFMAELHSIITEQDLAEHNGLSIHVGGLPPKLGCDLYVTYASGEQISAHNNQTNFLALKQMEALEALFREAAFGKDRTEDSEGG